MKMQVQLEEQQGLVRIMYQDVLPTVESEEHGRKRTRTYYPILEIEEGRGGNREDTDTEGWTQQ